ncbi:MAG: hypothetical protein WC322_06870 [Candidatus Paceibacterota bacterium]|jgi:hypothetical protein
MNTQPPPMPPDLPPPLPAVQAGPLTPEHMQALAMADQRAKKLRSAAGVAKFNYVCFGTFGVLSLLIAAGEAAFGVFDWLAVVIGLGLGAIAWNESRGRKLMLRFDPKAPSVLGWNQVALIVLITAYAAWMISASLRGPSMADEIRRQVPDAERMLGGIGNLQRTLTTLIYGSLIAATLIFQGINALYYFSRGKILRTYLAETPEWVVQFQRTQAGR